MDLKVLFLTTEYPPYIFGGGGIFAYNLTRSLANMNINVSVIAASTGSTRKLSNPRDNVNVFRISIPRVPPQHVWFQLQGLPKIISIINNIKPDVIHANSFSAAIIFRYLKESNAGYPLLVTLHGYPRHYLRLSIRSASFSPSIGQIMVYTIGYPLWDFLLSFEVKYSDVIVTMSRFIINSMVKDYNVEPDRIVYIPNGIDLSIIERIQCIEGEETRIINANDKKYIILTGGRLFYEKGLFLIPYIARKLKEYNYNNVLFLLFGDGPYRAFIEKTIRDLNVSDIVRLLGKIPHKLVLELLCIADIVLIPSIYELMPMFLLEAIAMKKPVIVLRSHYTEDLRLKGITLEEAGNINDMASKIIDMLNNIIEWKRIAQRNYNILIKEFNILAVARKYIDVYKSLIG